jgi:hypothetical protein
MHGKCRFSANNLAWEGEIVYRMPDRQLSLDEFYLGFSGTMDPENRWVQMSRLIPWENIEKKYAKLFVENNGQPAKPLRMALGTLIIKEKFCLSDEETVEHIKESPYLQYFIGLRQFQKEAPFDPSLMVNFRKRLTLEILGEINEWLRPGALPKKTEAADESPKHKSDDSQDPPASGGGKSEVTPSAPAKPQSTTLVQGKLILDATCAPADIRFPTDLSLLNEARENLESILDTLHAPLRGVIPKPRSYRRLARKDFLRLIKQKQPKTKAIRKAIRKQLGYVTRTLAHVDQLLKHPDRGLLTPHWTKRLPSIRKLLKQQREMFRDRSHRTTDRIVSLHQPHVRPIIRGKANAYCEFGAKVAISVVNGHAAIEKLSWDAFNEGSTLVASVEEYRNRYGYYPEAVLADKIYRTRDNLAFCKTRGIRLSGPRLGRPPKITDRAAIRLEWDDNRQRNEVEGKFGEGKRCYGMGRIMARLKVTAECVIGVQFLVMNLQHRLRILLRLFWHRLLETIKDLWNHVSPVAVQI